MELWYRKIGFYNNPFSIKPAAFHDEVIGHDLKQVLDNIENGNMLYVKADYGNGKTTMLKHIIRKFGGKKMVAYCSCSIAENKLGIEKLLLGRSIVNSAFRMLPKNMILLVDEAQDMTRDEADEIMKFYRKGNLKAVVFFGTDAKQKSMPKDLINSIKGNVINFSILSPERAVELVRKRIGDTDILPDSIIKKLYLVSGENSRRLLENCEDLCRHVVSKNEKIARESHVRELFNIPKRQKAAKRAGQKQKKSKNKEPQIKIEEIDGKNKPAINMNFDLSNIKSYEEEMAFGRNQ